MKTAAFLVSVAALCAAVADAQALSGGFGGTSGGGARGASSGSAGFNRAGTASSGHATINLNRAKFLFSDFVTPVSKATFSELHDIAFVGNGERSAVVINSVLNGFAH